MKDYIEIPSCYFNVFSKACELNSVKKYLIENRADSENLEKEIKRFKEHLICVIEFDIENLEREKKFVIDF